MKRTGRLAEDGVISLAERYFSRSRPRSGVVKGIGDDAAVVRAEAGVWLWSCDQLVEGVHFQRGWLTAAQLGRKLVDVNLSDMAAMGGRGLHGLLSAALPGDLDLRWVEDFFQSLSQEAGRYGLNILGGDTTGSPGPVMVSLSLWGLAQGQGPVW
ncbi:MAG: thiamine-phosphate kinase, partial [Deltaproteobacteria bacterium]|nr:thiamine-phosphate kinase [Deltaproteobacteria bacterium]